LLDDQRFGLFSGILEYWVLNDLRNILRQQMGMRSASGPSHYATKRDPAAIWLRDLLDGRRTS